MAHKVLTTHQVAKECNVHHTTVINWVTEGKLKAYTTPGGHRRISEEDLVKFMKKYEIPIPDKILRKRKRILIVDDDIEALEELKSALSGSGLELDFASNGFEAGRKIYTQRPDLILLDFKMPGLNGFEVCKILNMYDDTSDIPVVAVTILNTKEDVKKIKDAGVVEYIPKPIDVEKILKVIRKILK